MMLSKISRLTLVAIIFSLTLVLVSCGVQAAPVSTEPDEVSFQLSWVHQAQFAGFYLAEQDGFYTDENLVVQIIPGGPGINTVDKVVAKEANFGITDPIRLLRARAEGKPIVVVAAIFQKDPSVWISLASKNIKTAKDMVGKRIGVKVTNEATYRMLMAAAKIDQTQVTEVPIEDPTIRPLIDESVDVLPGFALNEPLAAKAQGYDVNVISLADEGIIIPAQILFVHEDLVKTNPELIKRFVKASLKGWEAAVKDPKAGLEATLKVDETLDVNHQTQMMEAVVALVAPEVAPIGFMDEKTWQKTMQLVLEQGLISEPIELDKFYTTQFIQ